MEGSIHRLPILRSFKDNKRHLRDVLVRESAITIFYNGRQIATLLCTPVEIMELTIGFLFFQGILSHFEEIRCIWENPERGTVTVEGTAEDGTQEPFQRVLPPGCNNGMFLFPAEEGRGSAISTAKIILSSHWISRLIGEFYRRSQLYLTTGGVHSCALANEGGIIIFKEDIGRHNALDKVAGKCVMEGIATRGSIILTTGRVSSVTIIKVKKMEATFLISRGAPTDLSVALAKKSGITLIGFCRGARMNIYSHPERIIFKGNGEIT